MSDVLAVESDDVAERILAGLTRIALVLRHRGWVDATEMGITPTQGQILTLLASRPEEPLGVSRIATELSLTKPTVSDSISTLVRKELVEKVRSGTDGRAVELRLTARGRQLAEGTSAWPEFLRSAALSLSEVERALFLRALVKMVRTLQRQGHIPVTRMCVNCRFFGPHAYEEAAHPHHCGFLNAAIGDNLLQVDCRDFGQAGTERMEEVWIQFAGKT
jgi:DNA-binding MarR family transcriptional regulator